MNLKKLNVYIEKSGYRKQFIANKIGLSYQGLSYKLKGKSDFTVTEMNLISKLLRMTEKEKKEIFFKSDSD